MDRRRPQIALHSGFLARLLAMGTDSSPVPPAVYRDLVASLFTMKLPIVGLGLLYVFVGGLIFLRWPDPMILVLTIAAAVVTVARILLLNAYHRAGGAAQQVPDLAAWESRYTTLAFLSALLIAGLNMRVLTVHQPLMLTGTISLVFTFGAGVVSRTSCRPRACIGSLLIAVVPTVVALLAHATTADGQMLHGAFFVLLALLMSAVLAMSLDSVRHLHAAALEQLITKHDLAKLARYDALTGLANRLMLRDVFHASLALARQRGTQVAIHYLDLDGFKAINDRHGHPVGDCLLKEVAERLVATVRSGDVACRLGGDEFAIIQIDVQHRDEADLLARRVIKSLSDPYVFDGVEMRVSVSVGIALTTGAGAAELDELLGHADAALYRSKARGKAQLQFFEAGDPAELGRSAA